MNRVAGFRAVVDMPTGAHPFLRITASTVYRVFFDGAFIGYGPVRAPHGFFRVDEWPIAPLGTGRRHVLAIEVSSYNINTYYQVNQPAFLQAELVSGDEVLASTAGKGVRINGRILAERVQRVERYSVARGFSEAYRLRGGFDLWRTDPDAPFDGERLQGFPSPRYLPRRLPHPVFTLHTPQRFISKGTLRAVEPDAIRRDWTLTAIGPDLHGFREDELEVIPSIEIQRTGFVPEAADAPYAGEAFTLGENEFRLLDFGTNLSGFIGCTVDCPAAAGLTVTFDEILTDGDVDPLRLRCVNVIRCDLRPGRIKFESIEPYTLRYVKFFALGGPLTVSTIFLREYASPEGAHARFHADDPGVNAIFRAGVETLRQNSVDLLTDCPSRERAGWLCDSFFLARTTDLLYGNALHEKNFFENYLLPPSFRHIPAGMLPMCFPADHDNAKFIPNWALWFVLQLEEYLDRTGDREMVTAMRERVMGVFEYLRAFENVDGLLEKLAGWIFVEWSEANTFVQDVNYPTNMLYAAALRAAGTLYDKPELAAKAAKVAERIRGQSFDGNFFVDNAVRIGGKLVRTENRTEVCQYHAFTFGIATPESHPVLWGRLRREFGVGRPNVFAGTGVHPANALLGYPLRFELLSRFGDLQGMIKEAVELYKPMADLTGTLWEHVGPTASCCHGFASHIASVLLRDVLGVYRVDRTRKHVTIRLRDSGISSCSGQVPVGDGVIAVEWSRRAGKLNLRLSLPGAYRADVENLTPWFLTHDPSPPAPG